MASIETSPENLSMSAKNSSAPTPMHLRAIGLLGLLWSAMGAMDFVMTLTRNE